ncbi:acyl-CoA desaturase [Microcoleus sp. D2_18a_D3]|uniref:acyl-CoA desaturase n=1 Tax=Microcoleus sp. D2_18a_D3 TaxID=3055330 RepID=UPI002FD6F3CD
MDVNTSPFASEKIKVREYISSPSIQRVKRLYVATISLATISGCLIGIFQLCTTGIGYLEVSLLLLMTAITGSGITVGFHRFFTHKTFDAHPIIQILLAVFGSMAGEGSLIAWVSVHRCHHQYTDVLGDPHSPHLHGEGRWQKLLGLWHAHIGWMLNDQLPNSFVFAKDLYRDPVMVKINNLYPFWILLGIAIPTFLGGIYTWSWSGAFAGFIWGGLVRLFFSFNGGYLINSIAHYCGNRMFETRDHSTNNIWLAIPTFGEGWHNNHHAFPGSAKFGLKWWQIDLGYWVIWTLKAIGLVGNVKLPTPEMIVAKKADVIF